MKKSFLSLFALVLAVLAAPGVRAQAPFGALAATFPYQVGTLLADPTRDRVYATLPASNSILVVDTDTLSVLANLPIGSDPVGMAISRDGNRLYVANSGSTLAAIGVINLNTLTVSTSLALPGAPKAIAAGLGGRLYVSAAAGSFDSAIYQVNGATGAVQTTFNAAAYANDLLAVSPDGKTLYVANNQDEPGGLQTFDISTAPPAARQTIGDASVFPKSLVVSHNGKYLCLPGGSGNPGASGSYDTLLFSATDITNHYGSFDNGGYPGVLSFSADDSQVFQVYSPYGVALQVFSTVSFAQIGQAALPVIGQNSDLDGIPAIVTDRTGSYLFVGVTDTYDTGTPSELSVLATGAGTLTPASIAPVITGPSLAVATIGQPFFFQVVARNAPTSYVATGLPDGLDIDPATGLISGTPGGNIFGYVDATVTVANASGSTTANLQLDVEDASGTDYPVITTATLPDGVLGLPYHAGIVTAAPSTNWTASGLPAGLSIDAATGVISGTPTLFGPAQIVVTVANADYDDATASYALNILQTAPPVPAITSLGSAAGVVGAAFSYQITATNSPTGYTASGLPAGLRVNQGTGLISGVPTTAGTFAVGLTATNAGGTATVVLSLTVTGTSLAAPVVNSPTTALGSTGAAFTYQITATNSPTGYGVIGTLPNGLSLNGATGLISGTPLDVGTFNLVVTATNAAGTGMTNLTLTVATPLPVITNSVLTASVTVGQPFTYQITATNDPTKFGVYGLLPGLSVDANGLIQGAPTAAGTFDLTLVADNAYGSGTAVLVLTVNPEVPVVNIAATVPRVTAGSGDDGEITITRTGGDLSSKLLVYYLITGSARNGSDYYTLTGVKKIKPNHASATIHIVPKGTLAGESPKKVKLVLGAVSTYRLGDLTKAKVKIIPGE